ncbi:MAG: hypothetical protein K9L32_00635 [Chromatiaceae bacterium]|nr:hypothetical protein [Chromatiaceae bacterium]MCF8002711.1 hypothetical protein [Chromatiaceae bacterium]
MPFTGAPTTPAAGHFCYGLWTNPDTPTMKWLKERGCISPFSLGAGPTPSGKPGPTPLDIARTAVYGTEGTDENSANKQRSKVGLALLAHHSIPVHFALDLLDMGEVAGKSRQGETATNRVITNAELRFLFRHRDNLKIKQSVQFWLDKEAVVPPWDEKSEIHTDKWQIYETHLKTKSPKDHMELNLASVSLTGLENFR